MPGCLAACTPEPGLDPSGLQPGRARWRQKHTLDRRSRLCLGPHWAIWRHFQDHLPILVRHSGTLCWVRAGLQGRLLGQSPPKSKHGTPHPPGVHPLCPAGGHHRVRSLPQRDLPELGTSWWSFHPLWVLVLGVLSTETRRFSRLLPGLRPHLLQLPHHVHLPVFRDYILCAGGQGSSGSQDPQSLRSPPPCPPPPWRCLVPAPSPSALPPFSGRLTWQVILLIGLVSPVRPLPPVSCPGLMAVLAVGWPLEALEAQPGSLCFRS